MTTPLPNINSPLAKVTVIVNGKPLKGEAFIVWPWNSFLQQFVQAPPHVLPITLTGSPFSITPNGHGTLIIIGGTISDIILTRGTVDIDLTGQTIIPIRINDMVTVTYSVEPTLQFLPD
jgi:hypothetical protein